jgi:hypothetical protein
MPYSAGFWTFVQSPRESKAVNGLWQPGRVILAPAMRNDHAGHRRGRKLDLIMEKLQNGESLKYFLYQIKKHRHHGQENRYAKRAYRDMRTVRG